MSGTGFAFTPEPPYYAVIFSSLRKGADDNGYSATADRMMELAATQPGFLGVESVRGGDGFGITVSYWDSEASIRAWKLEADHTDARRRAGEPGDLRHRRRLPVGHGDALRHGDEEPRNEECERHDQP